MKYHANAKLTLRARRELVERMQAGWSAGDIADQMNVSTATVYKWWRRWQTEGDAGYLDFFARSAGLFVDGSLNASIWQRVG